MSSQLIRGIVKQVQSGDSVIIRGQPKNGPPPEKQVFFSNIIAPKLARRATQGAQAAEGAPPATDTKDEPFAFDAREFLRKKLVGKEVTFRNDYQTTSGRDYGFLFLGKDTTGENISESLISEGLAEVKRTGTKQQNDELLQRLGALEDAAKAAGKGKWASETEKHVRNIVWNVENPRNFVDSLHNKPVEAIVEHIRDGCTLRVQLLPNHQHITLMLAGIKTPMFRRDAAKEGGKEAPEPFAEESKFFVESRMLQRDVKVILEGVSNQNFLGTVIHPNGNIAEALLREGYARCVDWSIGILTSGGEPYRKAEKMAKEKRLRIWKSWSPPKEQSNGTEKSFQAKVIEIVGGDAMMLKMGEGKYQKIFLSSLRPPRATEAQKEEGSENRKRPLFDVPHLFEAREFLRKRLVGKKVNITVDYVQPKSDQYAEKTCCTVALGDINVAEALIQKGLATVMRHRQDDDQRSSHYDALLAAEAHANKKSLGVHSSSAPTHRIAEVAGDPTKAKQFLPSLQRAGRVEAVVEFVASGSRTRLFIPKETCLITFLLGGINCPRGSRPIAGGGGNVEAEPYSEEAHQFTRDMCMQHDVDVKVESLDKAGNFIGWMFVDGKNVSVALVEHGLASVYGGAERSEYFKDLVDAESRAKDKRLNLWKDYVEEKPKEEGEHPAREDTTDRTVQLQSVVVTEVDDKFQIYAQHEDQGPQLEELMRDLRRELAANPPLGLGFAPKKGALCVARYVDNEWYRAKIEDLLPDGKMTVLFIDYGNKEEVSQDNVMALPAGFTHQPPQAKVYVLALLVPPEDEDYRRLALNAMRQDILQGTSNGKFNVNFEYKSATGADAVTLSLPGQKEDVGRNLVAEGFFLVEARRDRRMKPLVDSYFTAQKAAKKERHNIWEYGDFTQDEAKEFGFAR